MHENSQDLGTIEHATIYSDLHFTPRELISFAGTSLRDWRRSSDSPNFSVFDEVFDTPPRSGELHIVAGDAFHLAPQLFYQKELVPDALRLFADVLYKRDIHGDQLKFIPGNHTSLDNFPGDVVDFLNERNILVPSGQLNFKSGGNDYHVIHGHEAQPGHYAFPFESNPKVEKVMLSVLDWYRKVHKNGDVQGEYPLPAWSRRLLNGPQMAWQNNNLPFGTNLISGHTHVRQLTENHGSHYLNTGFLDNLFGFLSYGKVDNGIPSSRIREI